MGRPSRAHSPSSALVADDRERGGQEGLSRGARGSYTQAGGKGPEHDWPSRLPVSPAWARRVEDCRCGEFNLDGGWCGPHRGPNVSRRDSGRRGGNAPGGSAQPSSSVRLLAPLLCITPTTSSRHCVIAISTRPPALEAPGPATGSLHTVQRQYP